MKGTTKEKTVLSGFTSIIDSQLKKGVTNSVVIKAFLDGMGNSRIQILKCSEGSILSQIFIINNISIRKSFLPFFCQYELCSGWILP